MIAKPNTGLVLCAFGVLVASLSCKSSDGNSRKDPVENLQPTDPNGKPSPSETGGESDTSIPKAAAVLAPNGFPSEKNLWNEMRNDCGGTERAIYMDLNQLGVTGGLQYPYAAMVIDMSHFSIAVGSSGVIKEIVNPEVCRIMTAYFSGISEAWKGRDYLDVFNKGDRVTFEPEIEIDYRSSITLENISSFTPELASPKSFPVENPDTTISIETTFGKKGVVLIDDVPMKLSCTKPLTFQLYTYQSTFPDFENAQKYCRKRAPSADGRNAECVSVDHSICPQRRDADGSCPVKTEAPALDACSYLIDELPLINFSGDTIAKVKVGGYLFKKPKDAADRLGYRMTVHRVEIISATP